MKKSIDLIAFITALSLHLIIGGVLLMGIDFSFKKDKPQSAAIINATIINQNMLDDLAQNAERNKRVKEQKIDDERKEKARKAEQEKRDEALVKQQKDDKIKEEKAEIARKEKEVERIENEKLAAAEALQEKQKAEEAEKVLAEKKKADVAAKVLADKKAAELAKAEKEKAAKVAEAKAIKDKADKDKAAKEKAAKEKVIKEKVAKEKAAKEKAVKEKAAKAKAAKEKAAKEAKRKAAAEKERLRQQELDRQMEAEFSDDFSSARSAQQTSEIAKYQSLIRSKISRNWKVDSSMRGRTCTLRIKLAPDGLVLSAVMSSGDKALCDSARRATLQANTLPIPNDAEIAGQFRDFDIKLEPDL